MVPTPTEIADELTNLIAKAERLRARAIQLPTARQCADLIGNAITLLDDAAERLATADHFGDR